MTQKSESVSERSELLIRAEFAADAALKRAGFDWPSDSTREEIVKAVAKFVILRLAEEAEQEAREKLNGPLVDYDYGIAAQHAAAWLREKAR